MPNVTEKSMDLIVKLLNAWSLRKVEEVKFISIQQSYESWPYNGEWSTVQNDIYRSVCSALTICIYACRQFFCFLWNCLCGIRSCKHFWKLYFWK